MGKLKIWEILLFVAVILLAALVYEAHNDGGRYVTIPGDQTDHAKALLDTRTGKVWIWSTDEEDWVVRQKPSLKVFKWAKL